MSGLRQSNDSRRSLTHALEISAVTSLDATAFALAWVVLSLWRRELVRPDEASGSSLVRSNVTSALPERVLERVNYQIPSRRLPSSFPAQPRRLHAGGFAVEGPCWNGRSGKSGPDPIASQKYYAELRLSRKLGPPQAGWGARLVPWLTNSISAWRSWERQRWTEGVATKFRRAARSQRNSVA